MFDGQYVLAGALAGFVVGVTGVGGGALMTPILLLLFKIAPVTAIATDLWFAGITKIFAALVHSRTNKISWSIVRKLWIGSIPVSLIMVFYISSQASNVKIEWLSILVAIMILITSIGLVAMPVFRKERQVIEKHVVEAFNISNFSVLTILSGGLLGFLVATTSVGAGALGTVALLCLYPTSLKAHSLISTEIAHSIPLAIFSGIAYSFLGLVDRELLVNLLLGSIPATILGSLMANRISDLWIKRALALILLCVSVKIFMG